MRNRRRCVQYKGDAQFSKQTNFDFRTANGRKCLFPPLFAQSGALQYRPGGPKGGQNCLNCVAELRVTPVLHSSPSIAHGGLPSRASAQRERAAEAEFSSRVAWGPWCVLGTGGRGATGRRPRHAAAVGRGGGGGGRRAVGQGAEAEAPGGVCGAAEASPQRAGGGRSEPPPQAADSSANTTPSVGRHAPSPSYARTHHTGPSRYHYLGAPNTRFRHTTAHVMWLCA